MNNDHYMLVMPLRGYIVDQLEAGARIIDLKLNFNLPPEVRWVFYYTPTAAKRVVKIGRFRIHVGVLKAKDPAITELIVGAHQGYGLIATYQLTELFGDQIKSQSHFFLSKEEAFDMGIQ